jgi:hypothetical protein
MAEQLVLSRSLYLPEAVEAAVQAYAELATFEVDLEGADIAIAISDIDPDVEDVLVDEFCNHVLGETISRTRAGR